MALTAGTRVGPYEVVAQIGKGGMGEVYRATDTNLGRHVAIKVLPDSFARDPERLTRFEREAKALAALNHPNIAQIYGFERTAGGAALVMELVEGPTLADRIAQAAIPVDEALAIAKQIAEALEAAHDQGIIHRDLKPANIKVRPDGTAKVLDFGLAKATEPSGAAMAPNLSQLATITTPAMTQAGVILGTAAYMSPEQARGRVVDRRTDIWAFGCVFYEMLTGLRAYPGEDITDTIVSVVSRQPDWSRLPAITPAALAILRRSLDKDPKQRLRDIGEARVALEGGFDGLLLPGGGVAQTAPVGRRRLAPLVAALVVAAAGLAGAAAWLLKPTDTPPVIRFRDVLEGQTFTRSGRPLLALTADGRQMAYVADGQLRLRSLDSAESHAISGSQGSPNSPAFSPDGQWLAYYAGTSLTKIQVAGGVPVSLAGASNPFGISWARDGSIFYGQPDGIWRVSSDGGEPEHVVKLSGSQRAHGPQLLPGGDTVLFGLAEGSSDDWQVVVQSLTTGRRTIVRAGGSPRYVPSGHLLFALQDRLFAQPFDPNRFSTSGGPVPLVPQLRRAAPTGLGQYSVSESGVLVYTTGPAGNDTFSLAFVDRSGAPRLLPGSSGEGTFNHPRLSPDNGRIAVRRIDTDTSDQADIWIYEVLLAQWRQLTFEGGERPIWRPDGGMVTFVRNGSLWNVRADFSGQPEQLRGGVPDVRGPLAWSPDGRMLLYETDAGVRAVIPGDQPLDTLVLPNAGNASLSPDGRWVVYQTDVNGEGRVFARPFPITSGGERRLTTAPTVAPLWSPTGDEVFVFDIGSVSFQAIKVSTNPTLAWQNPAVLFRRQSGGLMGIRGLTGIGGLTGFGGGRRDYDVTSDGQYLLMSAQTEERGAGNSPRIEVIVNWDQELKRTAPAN